MTTSFPEPVQVLIVLSGFGLNGATVQLLHCLNQVDRNRLSFTICGLSGSGPLIEEYRALGYPMVLPRRRFRFDPLLLLELAKLIRSNSFDLIYTPKHTGALWGRAAAWLAGHKTTVTHEHGSPLNHVPRFVLAVDGFQSRRATMVLVNSQDTRERVVEYLGVSPERIRVLYNAIGHGDLPEPGDSPHNPPSHPVIGFTGRLVPFKGADLFLRALPEIFRDHQNATANIIGEGTLEPDLHELARDLAIEDRVKFLPWFSSGMEALKTIDILVMPSLYEPFGNVLLEAALMEVPAVAARVGGIIEIAERVGHTVLIRPDRPATSTEGGWRSMAARDSRLRKFSVIEPSRISEEVAGILDDPARFERLSRGARGRALEAFPMERHVREFEEALLHAAGNPPG